LRLRKSLLGFVQVATLARHQNGPGPFAGKSQGDRQANAARTAGNQYAFVFELQVHGFSWVGLNF